MDCDCYPSLLTKVLPLSVERTSPSYNKQLPPSFASLTSVNHGSHSRSAPATLKRYMPSPRRCLAVWCVVRRLKTRDSVPLTELAWLTTLTDSSFPFREIV